MESEVQYGDHLFIKDGDKIVGVRYLGVSKPEPKSPRDRVFNALSLLLLAASFVFVLYASNRLGHALSDNEVEFASGAEIYKSKTGYLVVQYVGVQPTYYRIFGQAKIVVDSTLVTPVYVEVRKCRWWFGHEDHVDIKVAAPWFIKDRFPHQYSLPPKNEDREI